ncbi:MAG TPA: restriction endonuclease subunit S [Candidatus Cloacimonadota bacterium]|nr:restriction endonuclease subunit S [Candidatus Cloacimonadota bacterium]
MKELKLNEVADIQMGYQARKKIAGSADSRYSIIMGKDIGMDNEIDLKSLAGIEPEGEIDRYLIQKGDILFMAKGSNNYAACIKAKLSNTVASGSMYILRAKTSAIQPCYLAWWLNQSTAQEHFRQTQSSGATISFISVEALRRTPVYLPDLATQQKIGTLHELYKTWKYKTTELLNLQEKLITQITYKAMTHKEKA